MCCLVTIFALLGPRVGLVIWWLVRPIHFALAYNTFVWPVLGIIFLPWTTFMYTLAMNLSLAGWVPICSMVLIGLVTDLGTYGGGAYGNRERIPRYVRR